MTAGANKILGRYQLLVAVARGGMGQVWLGRLRGARGFRKLVAVKTLLPDQGDRERLESMLAEEARLASLIQHANVVHTMELGEHEGLLYLVMEWVDGEPLGFLLERAGERGGMPRSIAVALVSQVLAGLHAAHELSDESGPLGVVHRDVSPHNILVTYDGVAKLLDFGIAKATHQASSNTETGEIKGKFSYMAPEQILGGEVDRRCDIFAAGVVLYTLTTGRHPFKHHNTAAVIHAITTDEAVTPPSAFVEDFPVELERVLLKALAKDPEKRWSTAEEMRCALELAMPNAFGDATRSELRAFMEHVVGDRKRARREAVRRAQLNADGSLESGTHQALQSSAQSASSLRAISISQPAPDALPDQVHKPTGALTLQAPVARRRSQQAPWLAATLGICLALGALAPRLLAPKAAVDAATNGVAAGPPLPPRAAAAPLESAPPAVAAAPSAAEAPPAPPRELRAPAGTAHGKDEAAGQATPAAPRTTAKTRPAPTKGTRTKPNERGRDDLLAPDYAH